jgi:monoamine oxidase
MWRMLKPVDQEDVFICGEAYSIGQGWVEGALTTAEQMLEKHFGLRRPEWLKTDYELMPCPDGGCGSTSGCIPATAMGDSTLAEITPNCLTSIQEG